MAGISSSITIQDNASSTFERIGECVDRVIVGMQNLDAIANNTFYIFASLDNITQQLDEMSESMQRVADNTENCSQRQEELNNSISRGSANANTFADALKRVAGTYLSLRTAQELIETSDALTMGEQKIAMVIDDKGIDVGLEEVNEKILQSANYARTSYTDMMAQIGKLGLNAGDRFNNMDEMIGFVEQFDKLAAIGGASTYESSQAMYQLTQSMAKGKLDGDELRSVMEGMPQVAQTIAKYLETDVGTMKDMAAAGELTADIVKNALLSNIKETNEKMDNLNYTWQQQFNILKNGAIATAGTLMTKINDLANNPGIIDFMATIGALITVLGGGLGLIIDMIGYVGENFATLSPIIWGVIAALAVYNATMGIAWLTTLADVAAKISDAISSAILTVQIFALMVAQEGFNAALAACPIQWIIIAIIALVAVIFSLIISFFNASGAAKTAFGAIMGAAAVAFSFIGNAFIGLANTVVGIGVEVYNLVASFANFFGNVFNNPVQAIANLFSGLFDFILGIVQSAASAIDALLGSDLSGAVSGFRNTVKDFVKSKVGEGSVEVMQKLDQQQFKFDRIDYKSAFEAGAEFGDGIADKFKNPFEGTSIADVSDVLGDIGDGLGTVGDNTGDTANAAKGIKDSLDITDEEIEWLKEIADREAINKYTTVPLSVEFNNTNNVSSDMDLDGITDYIAEKLTEAVNGTAEVVHY